MMDDLEDKLLKFIHLSEGIKTELRTGRTTKGRRESVADHTWRVTLMMIMFYHYVDQKINLEKALKMAIVHDLAEVITGDKPYAHYEGQPALKQEKYEEELDAMKHLQSLLPEQIGIEFFELWIEYEQAASHEAKFVKAIDKIEAQIQQNETNYSHWKEHDKKHALTRLDKYCAFDSFLTKVKTLVQQESRQIIAEGQRMNERNVS